MATRRSRWHAACAERAREVSMRSELWWRVFVPAWLGESEAAREGIDAVLAGAEGADGDALAVCARALFALGDGRAAPVAREALRRGGREAARLRVFVVDPRAPIPVGPPWAVAEAWCDRASRALLDGDAAAARDAVEAAREALPEHAEARRWVRFLDGAGDPVAAARRPRGRRGAALDAAALVATPARGFLAPERWERRYATLGPAPVPGSALARLRAAGVAPRLHRAAALQWLGADADAVTLELLADEVVARAEEGRPVGITARALLRAAAGGDPGVRAAARALATRAARRA